MAMEVERSEAEEERKHAVCQGKSGRWVIIL